MGIFRRSAKTSMPLPVPAAHLSFMRKRDDSACFVAADGFDVLSAYVKHGSHGGSPDVVCAFCVAGDFGDGFVCHGNVDASVACADDVF